MGLEVILGSGGPKWDGGGFWGQGAPIWGQGIDFGVRALNGVIMGSILGSGVLNGVFMGSILGSGAPKWGQR